jgi:uncharacterized protein
MPDQLNEVETRILGALVEKQLTTPEYYPLTLNALVTACNQKNNREPVTSYDEQTVTRSIENLRDRNLVYVFYGSTSRVPKYKHMLPSVYDLNPAETAVMCVMMLRGPQTLGELRGRTERLHQFEGLGEVQETLDSLIRRDEPLVTKIERQPGQKEARFASLISGDIDLEAFAANATTSRQSSGSPGSERIEKLEAEITLLREEVAELRASVDEFKKQFE